MRHWPRSLAIVSFAENTECAQCQFKINLTYYDYHSLLPHTYSSFPRRREPRVRGWGRLGFPLIPDGTCSRCGYHQAAHHCRTDISHKFDPNRRWDDIHLHRILQCRNLTNNLLLYNPIYMIRPMCGRSCPTPNVNSVCSAAKSGLPALKTSI